MSESKRRGQGKGTRAGNNQNGGNYLEHFIKINKIPVNSGD